MDDLRPVRERERVQDLGRDLRDELEGEALRVLVEEVLEAPVLAELEDHVGDGALELDVLDARDRGVLEAGAELGLPEEAVSDLAPRDLERHVAADLAVPRAVDDGLPARAEHLDDLVVPGDVARGERERGARLEELPRELARPVPHRGGRLARDRLEEPYHPVRAEAHGFTPSRSSSMSACACLRRAPTVFRSRLTASATSAWVSPPS